MPLCKCRTATAESRTWTTRFRTWALVFCPSPACHCLMMSTSLTTRSRSAEHLVCGSCSPCCDPASHRFVISSAPFFFDDEQQSVFLDPLYTVGSATARLRLSTEVASGEGAGGGAAEALAVLSDTTSLRTVRGCVRALAESAGWQIAPNSPAPLAAIQAFLRVRQVAGFNRSRHSRRPTPTAPDEGLSPRPNPRHAQPVRSFLVVHRVRPCANFRWLSTRPPGAGEEQARGASGVVNNSRTYLRAVGLWDRSASGGTWPPA